MLHVIVPCDTINHVIPFDKQDQIFEAKEQENGNGVTIIDTIIMLILYSSHSGLYPRPSGQQHKCAREKGDSDQLGTPEQRPPPPTKSISRPME